MGVKEMLLFLSVLFVAVHGKKDCCKLSGNGNFHQFDNGRMVHFRSNCTYNFASDRINNKFQIWVDMEFHHDNPAVSFADTAIIHYRGETFQLTVYDVIMPNGVATPIGDWPLFENDAIKIEHIGENIEFTLKDEGLLLFWHGRHNLEVCLDPIWKITDENGQLHGLCGNYNGNKFDDLVTRDGQQAEYNFDGYDLFGESWAEDWKDEYRENCTAVEVPPMWDVCSVRLDPHGVSIDDLQFKVTEVCTYDLALNFYLNVSMETYRRNVIDIRRGVSFVRRLIISYNGVEYSMYPDRLEVIAGGAMNGITCTDYQYLFCCACNVGTFKFCSDRKFSFYLHFEYYFYKSLTGLCGNFNGITSDDYVLRDGGTPSSMADFVASWAWPNC